MSNKNVQKKTVEKLKQYFKKNGIDINVKLKNDKQKNIRSLQNNKPKG